MPKEASLVWVTHYGFSPAHLYFPIFLQKDHKLQKLISNKNMFNVQVLVTLLLKLYFTITALSLWTKNLEKKKKQ